MHRKCLLALCLTVLTACTLSALTGVGKAQSTAAVHVEPSNVTGLTIGDTFTVNVTITDVTDLAGWEFKMFYNPQVLNATDATEGPFLSKAGGTFFSRAAFDDHYNSTHGRIYLVCATLPVQGVSGSGTLASVTFLIVGAGYSALALPEETTELFDSTPANPQPIPHTVTSGSVSVTGADISITSMYLSKTVVNATQVTINVTAANLGNFTGSFSVTLYYDTTEIATKPVTNLAPSASLNLTFAWDTTPIPKGNYTMSAYAPPIIGENNVANNRLTDGWIKVTILGDVNGDGTVNILDITILAKAFLTKPGDPKWNPNGDLDNSGEINIVDITRVAKEFGKTDP